MIQLTEDSDSVTIEISVSSEAYSDSDLRSESIQEEPDEGPPTPPSLLFAGGGARGISSIDGKNTRLTCFYGYFVTTLVLVGRGSIFAKKDLFNSAGEFVSKTPPPPVEDENINPKPMDSGVTHHPTSRQREEGESMLQQQLEQQATPSDYCHAFIQHSHAIRLFLR